MFSPKSPSSGNSVDHTFSGGICIHCQCGYGSKEHVGSIGNCPVLSKKAADAEIVIADSDARLIVEIDRLYRVIEKYGTDSVERQMSHNASLLATRMYELAGVLYRIQKLAREADEHGEPTDWRSALKDIQAIVF